MMIEKGGWRRGEEGEMGNNKQGNSAEVENASTEGE